MLPPAEAAATTEALATLDAILALLPPPTWRDDVRVRAALLRARLHASRAAMIPDYEALEAAGLLPGLLEAVQDAVQADVAAAAAVQDYLPG